MDTGLPYGGSYRTVHSQAEPLLLDPSHSNRQSEGALGYDLFDMPTEMYDAFLQIEPISVTMDPGFDLF